MKKDDAGHEGSTLDRGVVEPFSTQSAVKREQVGTSDRLSEERYRAFIESIGEGVYETDIDGRFVYFNDALCKVFGYPREEIQWQRFTRFMDQEQAGAAYEIFSEIYKTGSGISGLTWEIRGPDRQTRIIELSAHLITNQEGKGSGSGGLPGSPPRGTGPRRPSGSLNCATSGSTKQAGRRRSGTGPCWSSSPTLWWSSRRMERCPISIRPLPRPSDGALKSFRGNASPMSRPDLKRRCGREHRTAPQRETGPPLRKQEADEGRQDPGCGHEGDGVLGKRGGARG